MRRSALNSRLLPIFAALSLLLQGARAGELDSERDEDFGVAFVGSARQTGTLAPVPDVQVIAETGNRKLLVRTNAQGVYKLIANFGNDVTADNITISCAKEGYETVDVSRRQQSSSTGRELIVAECLLAPRS